MKLRIVLVALFALSMVAVPANAATTTFGSLAPAYSATNVGCSCERFQASVSSGPSYSAPFDGTITAFRMRTGSTPTATEDVAFTVVRPIGGGQYSIVYRSGNTNLFGQPAQSIVEIPTSVPVKAGDAIGLEHSTSTVEGSWTPASPTADDLQLGTGGISTDTPYAPSSPLTLDRLNLEASLSYTPTPPPPPPVADTSPPVITQFRLAYKRFRYAPKGAVITKRAHPGSTLKFVLSEPSTVTFSVFKAFKGKITKGVCKKAGRSNRKNHRCTKLIFVKSFNRLGLTGANLVDFSGRYTDAKGRVGKLHPGPYKIQAFGTDGAGNVGSTVTADFTVVH